MAGKRGLIMGVANDHSIAYGVARALRGTGRRTRLHLSGRSARQAGEAAGGEAWLGLVLPCDVEDVASLDAAFAAIREIWGSLDFLVHCIAYSEKAELKGRYADTSRAISSRTMVVSAFSFTELPAARRR